VSTRRLWTAVLLAPLAAPLILWLGSILAGVVHCVRAGCDSEIHSVASVMLLGFVFAMFGYLPSLAATALIITPAFVLGGADGSFRSARTLGIVGLGAATGAVLVPAYLHFLQPGGTIDLMPGAGILAGASVAMVFCVTLAHGTTGER
jgi:hypothetical protein